MMADQQAPDSAQFTGEHTRVAWSRDLKMKLVLVLGAIAFVLAAAAYVRHRISGFEVAPKAATSLGSDTSGQRKTKVFEPESDPPGKPPIDLPPAQAVAQAASAAKPTGFDTGLPSAFTAESLPVPKPVPPALKPMMLGDGSVSAHVLPGTALAPAKGAPLPQVAPGWEALSALLPLDKDSATTKAASASDSAKGLAAAAPLNGTANNTGKNAAPTVEAQALIAREKAGAQVTGTAQVSASKLGRRSFVLAKGAFIPCVLETQLVSNVFGMTSCVVTQNVYSDDGKVLLLERGSRVTGNYGSNLRNGDSRLAVVWDRIKTPKGITVDVNSPATDGVGAMGMPGVVDKHWFERIAGAILLSLVQDTIQYATSSIAYKTYLKEQKDNANTQLPVQMANSSNSTVTTTSIDPITGDSITTVTNTGQNPVAQAARSSGTNPPPVPVFGAGNTTKQGASIPEQVLASSINAAPTLYKNRGDVVYIFVANDLWFDRVYGLKE